MANKQTAKKAMEFVLQYERRQGRNPIDVSMNKEHRGYDIKSGERLIEVKGKGESWKTYTWQDLYKTEIECLNNNSSSFYLYIVKFKDTKAEEVVGLYIISGEDLKKRFTIEVETYSVRPINQASLKKFLVSAKEKEI